MPLQNPIAAYTAAHNVEAELVRNALLAAGIEAHFTADLMSLGLFAFGPIPEIHRPQVWIDQADAERSAPVLAEFERRAAELRDSATAPGGSSSVPIEQACEECGGALTFPAAQNGSVQECKLCGAFVDVGDVESDDAWQATDDSEEVE